MSSSPLRRDEVLRDVIDVADQRLDGGLPMDVPGVDRTFGDAQTLVAVLHVRWRARLVAEVERALAERPGDAPAAVVRGWRRASRALPGVRLVLDREVAEADGPRRAHSERRVARQRQWLAVRAGLAAATPVLDEDAVAIGAELEAEGRRFAEPDRRRARSSASILERLKSVLVA